MTSNLTTLSHQTLAARPIGIPPQASPTLFVVVDTEEEFDWGAPFARQNTSVQAIRQLPTLQRLLDRFAVKPTYVIDFPVATDPVSVPVIKELYESGRCAIGAHLHPWVTPPFVEDVTRANSFASNLGEALEEAKLRTLTSAIESQVGVRPRMYKAGRYGFGLSTMRVLERLGYEIDLSVNPCMDYGAERGPNFETFDARPFLFGSGRPLLEVPCTTGYAGFLRRAGGPLHRLSETEVCRTVRMTGILCRLRALNKIMLSPETSTLAEMQSLTRAQLADGVRTFSLTLHSPSVEPGHTPYVRSADDLRAFLTKIEGFCDFFFGTLHGVPGTLEEFHRSNLVGGVAA
ncbi:MAG: glycosyltransferase [Acidobacteria bacterium]|nr:glycosyltransferase [Acidobacteriota bacterium]